MSNLLTKPIRPGVYKCHWTGLEVDEKEMVLTSPIIPQVRGVYPAHPSYKEARGESLELFKEFDANCNTCKNFKRTSNHKGYSKGKCLEMDLDLTIYPGDHMGMKCWKGRG